MADRPEPDTAREEETDPLARFRDWRGFLAAAVAVNALFVWGMLGNVADPTVRTWFKALVWLPFNAIATAVYLMLALKLGRQAGGPIYRTLCLALVAGNWVLMLAAGH